MTVITVSLFRKKFKKSYSNKSSYLSKFISQDPQKFIYFPMVTFKKFLLCGLKLISKPVVGFCISEEIFVLS